MRIKTVSLGLAIALVAATASAADPKADWPSPVHDNELYGKLLVDRLEYAFGDQQDSLDWSVQGWYGGDYNRLWVKSEGEDARTRDGGGEADAEVLYGRLIASFWEVQAGVGQQLVYGPGPDHSRNYATIEVEGLAPYEFEVSPALRFAEGGDVTANLEARYELLFTQRLFLEPRLAITYAGQRSELFGEGQGLNFIQAGLRLCYQFRREFAPYVGVTWKRLEGETADLAKAAGEPTETHAVVAGIRMWF